MSFRPVSARWFELIIVFQELARTVECLSRTGAVQLEAQRSVSDRITLLNATEPIRAYRELAERYATYWPTPKTTTGRGAEHLVAMLGAARDKLAGWQRAADPVIAAIERVSGEHEDLLRLKSLLMHAGAEFPDLKLLSGPGPRLSVRLLRLPPGSRLRDASGLILSKAWDIDSAKYILVVGSTADIVQIEAELGTLKGRVVPLPSWLPGSLTAAVPAVTERITSLKAEKAKLTDQIAVLGERYEIAHALSDMVLIDWLNRYAGELRGTRRLAWITGWTSDVHGETLRRALDADGIAYVLRLSEAPSGTTAPSLLVNPRWVRAFEIFARMLGTPSCDESDPTMVLAFIAPLVFGFMFGDVGQGLVIFLAGLRLGNRVPLLQMLVPGGLAAMAFGAAFGVVFCREDLIPALWLRPLADPIAILVTSLAAGVVVLLIGLALDAFQAHWRGQGRTWWRQRAGLLVVYLGMLLAVIRGEGVAIAAGGAAWYLAGAAVAAEAGRSRVLASAAAELVEQSLRLFVNTVSFARLGAFALAHAGLSAAIIELATASGRIGYWPVLFVGNILIIALEGMVVGIQTTRLMLFEFFVRFLRAGGREFRPLPPPDLTEISHPKLKPGGSP